MADQVWSSPASFEELFELLSPLQDRQVIPLAEFESLDNDNEADLEDMDRMVMPQQPLSYKDGRTRLTEVQEMLNSTPGVLAQDGVLDRRRLHEPHITYPPILNGGRLPVLMDESYFKFKDAPEQTVTSGSSSSHTTSAIGAQSYAGASSEMFFSSDDEQDEMEMIELTEQRKRRENHKPPIKNGGNSSGSSFLKTSGNSVEIIDLARTDSHSAVMDLPKKKRSEFMTPRELYMLKKRQAQ